MRRFFTLLAVAAVAVGLAACNQTPSQKTYKAELWAANEVPPVSGPGKGTGVFTLDPATKQLSWAVTFSDLSGPATAAHIHGPAAVGTNAAVVVPFDNVPKAASGEIKGSKVLTDAQIADLDAGKFYVNVHTEANKGGEIRGQLRPGM
ncbi:MAG TPA: CHRD domain-containing protein [Stellaceae bacterium]|nr:CHRD domain-containing protein [Stellaceae bacterium]